MPAIVINLCQEDYDALKPDVALKARSIVEEWLRKKEAKGHVGRGKKSE